MSSVGRPLVFVDGSFDGSARVSVHDEAVLRGTGVFEVIGVGANRLIGVDEHLLRILRSISLTGISIDGLAAKAFRWSQVIDDMPAVEQVSERRLPLDAVLSSKELLVAQWLRHLLISAARYTNAQVAPLQCGSIRMVISRGTPHGDEQEDHSPRVFVIRTPLEPCSPHEVEWETSDAAFIPKHPELSLLIAPAPWHLSGRSQWYSWLHGSVPIGPLNCHPSGTTKWLSYGPNMASFSQAAKWGGHDALLAYPFESKAGVEWEVLEGTTFAALWHSHADSPLAPPTETIRSPSWTTTCPSRRDLLPSVTADLGVRALLETGQPVSVGGSVVEALAGDRVPCTKAWRDGVWAYGANTHDALVTSVQREAKSWPGTVIAKAGGVNLLNAMVTSDEVLALSSGKHISPVRRLIVPTPLLTQAAASTDENTASAAKSLLERGREVIKDGDVGRSRISMTEVDFPGSAGRTFRSTASAYWSMVIREGTPVV